MIFSLRREVDIADENNLDPDPPRVKLIEGDLDDKTAELLCRYP
jgi:hypothetical protein